MLHPIYCCGTLTRMITDIPTTVSKIDLQRTECNDRVRKAQ